MMNGINVPEEILTEQRRLEQVQSQRLLEEQGLSRVKKLHDSERAEMARLGGFKATLEEGISKANLETESIKATMVALAQEKESLLLDVEASRRMFVKINADIDEANAIHGKEREKIVQAHADLDSRSNEMGSREKSVSARENAVAEREGHIKILASKL